MTNLFTYGSAFTGIGGWDMGLDDAGGECLWQIEKDALCRAVLRRHWPLATKIADIYDAHRLATVTVFVFGSPCQDLSVAGLRTGLAGERSGLFFEAWRIIRQSLPRFVLFENVFGLLSSNEGRDFATVIAGFTGSLPSIPDAGWGNAGFMRASRPDCYNVAWRVLDAKYFGVPQRRRRVFLVASLGDGSCAEILFEPEAMCWDTLPSKEAEKDIAGTLGGCTASGGRRTTDLDGHGAYIVTAGTEIGTLTARQGRARGAGQEPEHIIACAEVSGTLCSQGKAAGSTTQQSAETGQLIVERRIADVFNGTVSDSEAPTITTGATKGHGSMVLETFHVGFNDANGRRADRPDGGAYIFQTDTAPCITTNGDSPVVVVAFDEAQITNPDNRSSATPGAPCPTLSAESRSAVAFRVAGDGAAYQEGEQTAPLTTNTDQSANTIVFQPRVARNGRGGPGDEAGTLTGQAGSSGKGDSAPMVAVPTYNGWTVRRLTPVEHERLQGFPDGWTEHGINEKRKRHHIKDGPRYRQTGNAVNRAVADWIGSRLAAVIRKYAKETL